MKDDISKKVQLDFIRYANCWEDPDVLLKGLDLPKNTRILSIASAGDNSFSLLTTEPEIIVAFDLNPVQLYLVELKKAAIKSLCREEAIAFLGFTKSRKRLLVYENIKHQLSDNTLHFWEQHLGLIEKGVVHAGKFERYFQFFSRKILPFIHSRRTVEALFSKKSEAEQRTFYEQKWNTWRWRLLFKIFFSKTVMGKKGRDPEFLKEVNINVGAFIFNKAALHLSSLRAQDNFILRYNLTGNFGDLLPHYLLEENYASIQSQVDRIQLFCGTLEEATRAFGKFDAMNLSDIFEYMNTELFEQIGTELHAGLNENGKVAYWNLMVPRKLSEQLPALFEYQKENAERLTAIDRGFFYQGFYCDKARL